MTKDRFKNALLLSTFVIGQLPVIGFGTAERLNLSFFVERSTRMDFFLLYYSNAFSFLILSHLLTFPKGVDKRIARFILIVCYFDLLHLLCFAKQGFGISKIALAIAFFYGHQVYLKWKR